EKMLLNLPAGSKYTFSMRTYDETGTNYSQSNYIVVDLPNWLSGCEGIPAAITYVALIQTDDELSEYAIEPYQATLDENSIVYDFYYQEWPADSSAYDVILIIGGYYPHFGTNGLGYFIDDATVRQDIEDFVAGGGSIYMEHDSAYFKIENMLIDKGDEIWLDNVFGLHSDGVDWDAYTGSAADKDEYNHVGGTFGTGNFLGGSTFGANSMMIPEDEIGVASESYRGFDPTPGDPVLLATEYEPIAGSKRLLATVTTVFIEGTPDAYDWAQQIVDYFGMQPLPTGGADTCPPGTVEDLTALPGGSDLSVTLRWTAPGEDVVMGKELGTASTYIIKYSASPITNDTEYNAATSVPTDPPLPSKAGTPESFSFTMPSEGTWYFALKTYDDQVNESALSNDDGLDLDAVLVAPKVMVLDRNPATYWMYYPYDGARDDFDVSTRIFDPICLALEELGVPYDLYIWDLPPVTGVSPDTYNTLMNYDVIFWSDLAFGKENETDTGCLTFQDTWRIADFLASGGRLYQEGNFVPSTYSAHETDGLTMDAHYWKYLGVESAGYYHWWRPTERLIGLEGTWTDGMEFKYDADGGVDLQPGVFDIAPGPRGVNAEYWFEDIDDPDYWHSDNYPPPNVARIVANDTAACKTIVSALPFGGFSTWDGTYPSTRVELMRRILQFFDFGGVEVHTSPEPIFFPKWSNNGKDVAFINGDYGSADIMIVEDAGIEGAPTTVNITNVGIGNIHHMSSITWSPDDQYLLYVSSSAPYPRVFKVKADNTLAAEVWQPTGSVTDWWGTTINVPRFIDPDWSHGTIGAPAKEKIIASLFGEIWAYNADGSGTAWGAVQVTDFQHGVYFVPYSTNPKVFQPKWSPTDDELVFVYRPPGIGVVFSGIYILSDVKNIITGNTNPPTALSDPRITAIFPYGYKPAWSPSWTHDATNIAFCVDKNKSFDNVIFWTDPDGQIASSNFDVYFRAVNLENNWVGIQELNNSEGFEEWSYSGGDKYVYSERSPLNTYHLLAHGSEVFKNSGISRGASKKDILIVNDHSKSYVKMSTSGYGDVKLSIKTPARIKSNGTSGLTYVGEAREIKTSPGAETFKNGAELVVHYTKQEAKDLHQRSFGIYYFDKIKNIWTPISGSVVTTYENGGYVSAKVYKQGTYAIFSGKKASAYTDLTEMRTFPNPYRPNDGKALTGTKIQGIVLDRLPDDIDKIKVYNIAGDLVATSDNGAVHYFEQSDPNWIAPYLTVDPNGAVAVWYGNNDNDKRVASGVYLITIKTTSGHEEVKKVAVIW
ncbi:hypothetical protein KAU33_01425, partial [Candidatus Dependentiae bacterium]|nr:hypothetical protein [Candidatus Dependentiae bacterium]